MSRLQIQELKQPLVFIAMTPDGLDCLCIDKKGTKEMIIRELWHKKRLRNISLRNVIRCNNKYDGL